MENAGFKFDWRVHFALQHKIFKTADYPPSSDLIGPYKSPKWKNGLNLWSRGQVTRPLLISSHVKSKHDWRKWPLTLISAWFLMFFSVWPAIRCLKIGTYVLTKVLLTYKTWPECYEPTNHKYIKCILKFIKVIKFFNWLLLKFYSLL